MSELVEAGAPELPWWCYYRVSVEPTWVTVEIRSHWWSFHFLINYVSMRVEIQHAYPEKGGKVSINHVIEAAKGAHELAFPVNYSHPLSGDYK